MPYQTLNLDFIKRTAVVTVNRPEKLNALNAVVISELEACFNSLNTNNDIDVVIITGSGEKAFIAGADIAELNKLNMIDGKYFAEKGQNVFNLIENFSKPVIAAVNGFALGGGCELALACHIRYASENAKFGQPEVNLGLIPGFGGSQRLPRLVNSGRAMEMILTGDIIDSAEAFRIGLANKIFPLPDLMNKSLELADKISSKGQYAVKQALKAVNICDEVSEQQGQFFEAALFSLCCGTSDFKEGTSAFLEKRKPVFKNL